MDNIYPEIKTALKLWVIRRTNDYGISFYNMSGVPQFIFTEKCITADLEKANKILDGAKKIEPTAKCEILEVFIGIK
jgi:hypothetical protein